MQRYAIYILMLAFNLPVLKAQGLKLKQTDWQQKANHEINVELTYKNNRAVLNADQTITYYNNSPDALDFVYLHLWANAYKNRNTPFALQQASQGLKKKPFLNWNSHKGYIDVNNLKVNGATARADGLDGEIAKVNFDSPLMPGESVQITMDFEVLVPPFYSRMGATESFVAATQWYPKPAVYDVNGWNTMPYLDQGEFYSEFGNYKVTITTPKDFLVASTGNLQNENEKLFLDSLSEYYFKDGYMSVKKPDNPWNEKRVVTYEQSDVHDFAWFASSNFKMMSFEIEMESGRKVMTRFFSTSSPSVTDLSQISQSLTHYSENVGEYPYDVCTVVIGPLKAGGGMEYPTITICSSKDSETVMHEIGHNWFYGILGSNEREFPWMDESINTFFHNLFFTENLKSFERNSISMSNGKPGFQLSAMQHSLDKILDLNYRRMGESQSGKLRSEDYNSMSYYSVVYGRNPHSFAYLYEYLGKERFKDATSFYYEKWKFKHPLPKDIQEAYEESSGENLDWFFDDLLNDYKGTDFKVNYIKRLDESQFEVSLSNNSDLRIPVQYGFLQNESDSYSETGFIPAFNKDTVVVISHTNGAILNSFRIDPYHILPELNRRNNIVYINTATPKTFKPHPKSKLKYLSLIENEYQHEHFVNIATHMNLYSGISFGLNFYNRVFPFKKFEYNIKPLYSYEKDNLIGNASFAYNFRVFDKPFYRIKIGTDLRRHNYQNIGFSNAYNRFNPYVTFYFGHKGKASERFKQNVTLQAVIINSDKYSFEVNDTTDFPAPADSRANYFMLNYSYKDLHAINPMDFNLGIEYGQTGIGLLINQGDFAKVNFNYKVQQVLKGFQRRMKAELRGGAILYKSGGLSNIFQYAGSGNNGINDYLFRENLFGRSELGVLKPSSIFTRQLVDYGGSMRINGYSFYEDSYLSLKLETSLPLIPIVRVYTDISMSPLNSNNKMYYAGGLSFVILDDIFEIYMPLFYSENFHDYFSLNNYSFERRMGFKLNLDYIFFRKNLEMYRGTLGY